MYRLNYSEMMGTADVEHVDTGNRVSLGRVENEQAARDMARSLGIKLQPADPAQGGAVRN